MDLRIEQITSYLEELAPPSLQESYDNSGLITGNSKDLCSGVYITLDTTEDVVDAAIKEGCNLIVSHHPVVFSGLKRLTGKNWIERTLIKAIKNDIAIYAIHTNLDNVMDGVNSIIAEKLGIGDLKILQPQTSGLVKLSTFIPTEHLEKVRKSLFQAGAGQIGNYDLCSYSSSGEGTFRAGDSTSPFVGNKGEMHTEPEVKLEVILPKHAQHRVLHALIQSHPYEEVAYDLVPLLNKQNEIGAGVIGELEKAMNISEWLGFVKKTMRTEAIRYTDFSGSEIKKVAVCGGSGGFLMDAAISAGADCFITSDIKYHQFFDTEGKLLLADIGHFESEQYTSELIQSKIKEKFANFAPRLKTIIGLSTNPVKYFI